MVEGVATSELVEIRQEVQFLRRLAKGFFVVATLLLALLNARAILMAPKIERVMEDMMGSAEHAPMLARAMFTYLKMVDGALPWLLTSVCTIAVLITLAVTRRSGFGVLIVCGAMFLMGAQWIILMGGFESLINSIILILGGSK